LVSDIFYSILGFATGTYLFRWSESRNSPLYTPMGIWDKMLYRL